MQGKFVWSINEFVLKICFQRSSQNKPFDQKWSYFFEVQILLTSQVQDRIFRSSLFWKYVLGECSIHLIKWAFWPNIVILFSKYKYLLLTKFEVKLFARICCPTGKRKKRGFFFFYSTDRKNELSKISATSLGSNRGEGCNSNKLLNPGGQSVKYLPPN